MQRTKQGNCSQKSMFQSRRQFATRDSHTTCDPSGETCCRQNSKKLEREGLLIRRPARRANETSASTRSWRGDGCGRWIAAAVPGGPAGWQEEAAWLGAVVVGTAILQRCGARHQLWAVVVATAERRAGHAGLRLGAVVVGAKATTTRFAAIGLRADFGRLAGV
jgi:hypothetical protein